jgi:hypothetical protein
MSTSSDAPKTPTSPETPATGDARIERLRLATNGRDRLAALHDLLSPGFKARMPPRAELTALLKPFRERTLPSDDPVERVHALAGLALLRSSRILPEETLRTWLPPALLSPPPPLDALHEVDDRTRVLTMLVDLRPPWAPRYALPYAVEAGTWKGRQEAIRLVLDPAEPFEDACASLADAFEQRWSRSTSQTALRALALVLADLDAVLPQEAPGPEGSPAAGLVALAQLARRLDLRAAPSREQRLVCDAFASLVSRVARSRLRRALSPETYRPLLILRGALTDQQWVAVVSAVRRLSVIADEVSEALFVSVRAGLPDPGLREALDALSPTGTMGRTHFERIAREPGVPPAMQRWLLGEDAPDAESPAAEAVNRASERELVASLVVAATSLEDWRVDHGAEGLPWERVEGLVEEVQALARRRGLRVGGFVGDVETFDPRRHMVTEMPPEGLTTVRLLTPLILCENPDGVTTVVRPAVTEAFRGGG